MNTKVAVLTLAQILLAAGAVTAAMYDFTLIAEADGSTGEKPFIMLGTPFWGSVAPSVNAGGAVAFHAQPRTVGIDNGIYVGQGGEQGLGDYTTIVEAASNLTRYGLGTYVGSNVAFSIYESSVDARGIFSGDGTTIQTVIQPNRFSGDPPRRPTLNSGGATATVVRMQAIDDLERDVLVTATNNSATTLYVGAQTGGDPFPGHPFSHVRGIPNPVINDAGQVLFEATIATGGAGPNGFFRGTGGAPTTIATSGTLFGDGELRIQSNALDMNNAGTAVFDALVFFPDGNYFWGIFTGDGGELRSIARGSPDTPAPGMLRRFGAAAINDGGDVAFAATQWVNDSTFIEGLFLAPAGTDYITAPTKIIAAGDMLFGSEVSNLYFARDGLNDAGQIAFQARLTDGRNVIALAALPQPFRWKNPDGGDWDVGANWLPGQPPGDDDTAEFDLPGVYTVRLTSDTTNAFMQVSGASAAEVASPRLQLIGNTYQAQQIAVQPHGDLTIDGFSGLVKVDHLHVAAGGTLRGTARVQPTMAGGATNVTLEGDIRMGDGGLSPQRRAFPNTDGGPEPAEFFAHFAVRGNYTQDGTGTMHVVLTPEKAVNESAIAIGQLPPPPRSAELFVTGDANLAGKLQATTSPGYVPQHGDKFVIIDSMAPINTAFTEYDVPTAFNGLPLQAVNTGTDVQLVTPQKVVLAWGHDAPFGLNRVHLFGTDISISDPSGATPALRVPAAQQPMFEAFQEALQAHVQQQFTDSEIQNIVIESGAPDPNAITVYFVPDDPATTLLGRAVSGVDRFNKDAGAQVVALIQNFHPAGPPNVELDAETVTHEIGHALGLRHVNPPGAISVMDYDTAAGDVELFQNDVFNITERPEAGGTVFADTHNPQYHLRRYVDGYSHEELVAQGIMPGTWDLPENVFPPLAVEFSFFAPGVTLYDASVVYTESAPDEARILAHFESITLDALAALSFEIQDGNGLGLIAASMPGGPHDIALLPGDPQPESELLLYPEIGVSNLVLQRELLDGFETLSAVTLTTAIVPEPVPGDYNGDGTVDAADYVEWRKTDGSPEGYNAWRGNFGRTAGSSAAGFASAAVPEPHTVVLLLTAMVTTVGRRRLGTHRFH